MSKTTFRIGKVRITIDGVYSESTKYSILATVTNEKRTKVYVSKVDNNEGNLLTDTTKWECIMDCETAVDEATKKIIEEMESTDTSVTLSPNKMYEFPEMASLAIAFSGHPDDVLNEWQFSFDSGSTATTFSVPSGVVWTSPVTIEANMHYEVNIVWNQTDQTYYGIIVGWDLPTT